MAESRPSLTDQQAAAISLRDLSVALSAGAGCGKTFVLTQRFLSHLERGPEADELSKLVAITFTERAAREMRERIREECGRRLEHCPPDDVHYWIEVVRDLESARISTIHSFCASLLRTHAVEAGIDPGFGLLEQATSQSLLRYSVYDALLARLEEGNDDAKELVLQHGLESAREILQSFVRQRFLIDFQTWSQATVEDVVERWQKAARQEAQANLEQLRETELAREVIQLLHENVPENERMLERREKILNSFADESTGSDPAVILQTIRENATLQYATAAKIWPSPKIHQQIRDGLKELRADIDKLPKLVAKEEQDTLLAAETGLLALRVAVVAIEVYEERKREAGVLDFDDLLLRARNLLRDSEAVQRSAAAGISMLMVDEFQDTDPVQAEIVRHLCGERLIDGKLFLVGDAKQSIYRFRRADPAVFAELRGQIRAEARLPLSMNFRSQPAILHFVNALFSGRMGEDYEPLVPHADQLSPSPSIEFLFPTPDEADETGKIEKGSAEERRRREAGWIARRLHQLLHDGVPRVRGKHPETGERMLRPAVAGDVVILLRAMTDVRYYEQALREHDLDYYLVGGRAFYAQQEIFDLISLCQYLDDCDDEVSLAGVLRSPFFSLRDETLFEMVQQAGSLSAALNESPPSATGDQQREQVRYASHVLAELRHEKDRLPLHQLLNLALARTGYDAALPAEFMGKRKLANLRKLVEMARQFDRSGLLTLSDFVARLQDALTDEEGEELAATHPETSNVIRLMTIHQAKGLEFPIVVVADMNRDSSGRSARAEFDVQLGPLVSVPEKFGKKNHHLGREIHKSVEKRQDSDETIRLLYVATTRAADHLILSSGLEEPGKATSAWMQLLAEYFNLETGQPAIDEDSNQPRIPEQHLAGVPVILVHAAPPALHDFKKQTVEGLLPLNRLRKEVEAAEPQPLPETIAVIAPDPSRRVQFSASELEQIDAELRAQPAPSQETSPRSSTDDEESSPGDFNTATTFGTLVHAVLEQLDVRQPTDVAELIASCSRAMPEEPDETMQHRAEQMIRGFLASSVADEMRTARHDFRELEFLLRCSATPADAPVCYIAGFIDCVYQTADGLWMVIDYKTGKMSSGGSDAEKLVVYELQLGTYALAIRQLLGRIPDRVELVLLADDCRRLSLDVNEALLADVEKRLNAAIAVVTGRDSGRLGKKNSTV